jgi:hypothetical protein
MMQLCNRSKNDGLFVMYILKLVRTCFAIVFMLPLFGAEICHAQITNRIFGAGAFSVDDGTGSGKSFRWDVMSPLAASYQLHFPNTAPPNAINFMMIDASGNSSWASNTLPPLSPGNIWYGNSSSVATPLAPSVSGAILSLDNSLMPAWTTMLPASTTVSASQITSGTLAPGTTITVGNGSTIQPSGSGFVIANQLTGSGINKYSASIPIVQNSLIMAVTYTGVIATSVVLASVDDPSGQTIQVSVGQITPGVGFTVMFSGFYPTTTGKLNYVIIN